MLADQSDSDAAPATDLQHAIAWLDFHGLYGPTQAFPERTAEPRSQAIARIDALAVAVLLAGDGA